MHGCKWMMVGALAMAGCNPHVVIEQPKPLEININFTGHLDLVIHDARQDLETITGEKPTRTVRPEDIGLPAEGSKAGGAVIPASGNILAVGDAEFFVPVVLRRGEAVAEGERWVEVALADDLKKSMAGRNAQIRAMWDSKVVGESHTGLLVAKGALSGEQQKLMEAENGDRTALYAAEAKQKSVTADEVAIGYYVARLGYAKDGAWYEKKGASGAWEWKQWGM